MKLALLALSLAITLAESQPTRSSLRCDHRTLDKMDHLIDSILPFGNHSYRLPEAIEQLEPFCRHHGRILGEIETINKYCMRDDYRNLLALFLYNFRKNTRNLCSRRALHQPATSPARRDQNTFLRLAKCANSGLDRIEKCAIISRQRILLMPNAKRDKKIPLLCCEFINIRGCVINVLNQQSRCRGPENRDTMNKIMEGLGASALNLACGDYENERKCRALKLPRKRKHADKRFHKRRTNSFLIPILDVLNSL